MRTVKRMFGVALFLIIVFGFVSMLLRAWDREIAIREEKEAQLQWEAEEAMRAEALEDMSIYDLADVDKTR